MGPNRLLFVCCNVGIKSGEAMGVLIVGGFEEFSRALFSKNSGTGEDPGWMASSSEASRDFSFDAIDEHAAADG